MPTRGSDNADDEASDVRDMASQVRALEEAVAVGEDAEAVAAAAVRVVGEVTSASEEYLRLCSGFVRALHHMVYPTVAVGNASAGSAEGNSDLRACDEVDVDVGVVVVSKLLGESGAAREPVGLQVLFAAANRGGERRLRLGCGADVTGRWRVGTSGSRAVTGTGWVAAAAAEAETVEAEGMEAGIVPEDRQMAGRRDEWGGDRAVASALVSDPTARRGRLMRGYATGRDDISGKRL